MRRAWFRRVYGASPLHLFALLACFAFAGYAALAWFQIAFGSVLGWFVVSLVAADLVLLPIYALLDWIAFGGRRGRARASRARVNPVPYIRVPAILSGLLALVFAPEILSLGQKYHTLTGRGLGVYLGRWLTATAIIFTLSGVAYAVALRRAHRRRHAIMPQLSPAERTHRSPAAGSAAPATPDASVPNQ